MAHYWPTRCCTGQALGRPAMDAQCRHKISKAERTPMAHRERTGSALVNAQG
ncbi:hypothetical protein 6993_0001 [Klebsiella phage 6993]|uniref:Uncharacterized protein n=1 Tax=Klebsiella phage 6993 TaxID=2912297 RepID=A0A9E7M8E8_9CAUD|nr:hypothetical protein 6993_0001 [Klebsiella phage 6993]